MFSWIFLLKLILIHLNILLLININLNTIIKKSKQENCSFWDINQFLEFHWICLYESSNIWKYWLNKYFVSCRFLFKILFVYKFHYYYKKKKILKKNNVNLNYSWIFIIMLILIRLNILLLINTNLNKSIKNRNKRILRVHFETPTNFMNFSWLFCINAGIIFQNIC